MADLWDAVCDRYPIDELVQITNPDASTATKINPTRADNAVTDAKMWFSIYGQQDYNSDNPIHVQIGVRGVIAMLHEYGGTSSNIAKLKLSDWREDVERYRDITSRARLSPTSPATLDANGNQRSEWANDEHWTGYVPVDAPSGD